MFGKKNILNSNKAISPRVEVGPENPLRVERDSQATLQCTVDAKPKVTTVRWTRNNRFISSSHNHILHRTSNGAVSVQSVLKFSGKARPNGNELLPSDRGVYTCSFENEVKKSESAMHLKIEHEPIVLHQYNKVAYDISETAEVVCKVQAYPKPEFKWFFGTNISPLHSSSEGHYVVQTTSDDNDVYTSILRISRIKKQDYGEYNCQIVNSLGTIEAKIRLQPKGPPEKPTKLMALHTRHNFVTLGWEPGFNGGISNTKYFVSYKKVSSDNDIAVEGCGIVSKASDWSEVDCHQNVPCNVTHLDQHQSYLFKVKALNTKRHKVAFDRASQTLSINVPATCLPLIAVVETVSNENHPITAWQVIDTFELQVSGLVPTSKEMKLDQVGSRNYKGIGRSLVDEPIGANMGYLENSYSNSNNGGSVNSQDSLWQMKMAAASTNSNNQLQPHHMNMYRRLQNLKWRIQDGGRNQYGGINAFSNYFSDYIMNADSPYHDVSGLPDPYLEQMEDEKPPQHMSLSYEESLESGYSTPNSRTRRVIREIIV
ncbi:hypothetical protein NQ318_005220 [Aromia moschata]|uniref:Uncharacterized protein n=1 Tax=Aromia moschata TaxID=1265417 RepID=A0AAV8XRB1_9CUCU|nr:hypothetical protein NQ318_005220 [Aromia moschata]